MARPGKAASIINNIGVARQLVGETRLGELLATLPPGHARAVRAAHPGGRMDRRRRGGSPFQTAMLQQHFASDEAAFRGYARAVASCDFNTFYKLIIRLLISPESLLERTAKLLVDLLRTTARCRWWGVSASAVVSA